MIVLIGESGSGKTSVEGMLEGMGYRRAISHTTRKPREVEVEGVNYFYVTVEELIQLEKDNRLGEHIEYMGNHYALVKEQITDNRIAVVEPTGLDQLLEKEDISIFVLYLYATEETRKNHMLSRGDNLYSVEGRIENDRKVFSNVRDIADFIVNTNDKSIVEVAQEVIRIYEGSKK